MKKIYNAPAVRIIDMMEEIGILAVSDGGTLGLHNESVDTQLSNKKEQDLWGNEDIWK